MSGNTNKRISSNKKLKEIALVIAIILGIIVIQFGVSKYMFNKEKATQLNFYEYRIQQSEIFISPETYTGEEVTVTITAEKPGLSVQYQLGNDGEWIDYTGPFSVDENTKINTRYVAAKDNFEGPITDKDVKNIAVAKIGDTYYKTLEAAIAACPENAEDTQTKIEMLTDVTESVVIPAGKNVLLDLCGVTVTGKNEISDATITVNGKFNIIDSTGDGKIVSSANCSAVKVTSTGDFTIGTNESEPIVSITNPIITGDKYGVIIETNGKFNFFDGKVMGKTNAINGSVTNKPNAYDISITLKGDSEIQSEKEYEIAVLTKTYVITYNGNCDNAEVEYLTETKKSGEKIGKLPTAQREGYLLKGWYTQPTDGTKITVDTVVSENTTYYAQWEAYTYTIIYNSNDKTKTTKNVACKYDADVIIEENSFTAPKGYTFKNWNTKEDGTGIIYNPATIVKNLTNKQSGIINLYAIWEDTIEPNTEASTAIATTSTITVQFNQTDDGTGINESTIEYAIKINGTWSDWQTGNTFENLIANTKYTIKTRVIDNAGNGPTESVETEITTKNIEIGSIELRKNDINGETIIPTTNKDDKSNQINNDINIKVTPAKTGTTTVVVKNQKGVTETITKENSTETADGGFQKTITTETGLYEITTITSDGTNETTETVYVYVDKTAPTVNSTNTKTTNTITVQANAVDDDSGLQTVTYEIKKGDTVIATNTTGKFTKLEDDTEYTITIIATDKAGNTTTDIQKIKTNKLVPGSLTFIEDPSNTSFIPSENIWINENVKTMLIPGNAGTTTYEVTSPDGTTKKYTTTQTIETVTGTYTVVLTTTDGTNTETVNYTFNVDKIAPTVTYGTNGGTYTIPVGSTKYTISSKITVTDNGGSKIADITYAWSTSNTTQPETWVTTTNGATIENEVTGGKYYLWVKTTDNAGNETITKTSPFDIGYAIEYDKNGGTGTITNQRKTHGTNITLNNGTGLSKTGYTFIGWSENQTATQAQYGKNASYTANKSVKLYAVWQANTYNISYVLNGGTNNSSNPSTYTYGKGATLSNATKQGYTFDGWYTESTFENKITSISTTQTGNITVYAKYNEITYTLTYDLAGGSLATGKVNPSNYTIGMTDFTLNNPTKTGYSFKGWTGGVVNAKGELDNTAETGTTENTTTPQTILVIKQGSLGNRKYTANWVDDIPPSTDAPSAVASTSTITVTSNQKDEGTGITSVKYAISEDGITWSEWQESDVFTALQPNKEYYVKTQATDNAGNNSESESKKVKTESLEAGSLAFYKNNINGASITPATTTEEEKPWVNSDIYVAMTRGTNGTTTYEVTSPDGTKQTYTNNATIPTVTGEYKITVITTDGNNTITKTYYIDVDKELPTAVYGTNGGTYTILVGLNTTNVSTKVTAQDNGGSGLSSVEYIWSKDSGTTPTEWTQTTSGATLTQSLEGGKNYLWIKTTDNAGNENIQISNEFNVGYEVKYNSNKGTGTIKSQRKEDGVTLKLNDGKGFARDGYTLLGWARSADATSVKYNLGGNFLLNEPSTLYAVWEANSNTEYKVEFYNQSNGTYSQTPTKTENRTGTTDTTVSITEQDKTAPAGYAYDTAAANIETGTVAGNGSLVLKVYYKQQFTVKYKPGTQGTFEETVFENLDYGTTTPEYTKSKTGKPGYTFAKWSPEIATTVTENIEYIATWSANTDTKYKVEHYKQTLTGTYELEETENLTGTTDETATAIAKTYDGFTENETNTSRIPTGTIAGDGSLTLKLYYDRNSYELTINHYVQNADDNKFTLNKTQTESGKVFGSTIEINTKKIDIENATYSYGTDSTGTTKTTITIASSNNVINLYYVRNTATLTVNHYVENANNAEYTLQSTKEIENIKIGSTITLANYVDTGIENVSLNTEKTQTTTTMSANGTTINLYYSRNTYVLTLSKNENIQSATGDGTYKWGQSVTINATVATQTGYTYTWNKWESNNTSLLANQTSRQVTITMPVGNVTLKATATKTANKYSIEYNSNGGSGTTASTQCTYDVEATIAQNAFVGPEGYKGFVKWNTNADGTGTTYNPGDKVKNLNSTQGGKVILYAIWEDIDAPQNEAPSAVANTNTITVTCNQTDSGTGIDETTIQYAIYKDGAWSEWQDSNIFTGLKANTQYKVKTKVSDKAGNGPTESEETTKSTTSIELGTLVFHKDSQTGNIINAPTAEPENPTYINNNIYIDMTAGPVGTTTYTVKDPDGVTTTYSEDKLITTKTGKYEITITTTDNVNSPSETYYIYVDKTNPTLKPTYTKTTNSIKVTANAQDADSGIDKITYVIKNGSTVIATNTTGKFTGLQNNFEYTVVTTVTDKAGNSASKTEIVKTNQLTVGTITFKESTTNTTFTPSADVWVNDDVKTTLVPGSAGTTTYEVTSPDGTKQTYTSSATLTTVNGTYTVTVKTTDGTNTKTRTYTFNVDKTEPTITFGTNGGTYTIPVGSTTIQISSKITGEDEGGSGISSVQYAWSTSNTTAPTQWTTIENGGSATLSAQGGKQYLWAKTEDKAGNEKVSTTAAFEIGYAIEYDVKGGTGTIANQRKVHGTNITLNSGSSLSKKGYTFKGWDTSETATKVVYAGGASYTTNQSVKLYAVWQINTYKITYNLNGGSLEQGKTNPTTYNINTATITLKNPTNISKPGYNFTGWTGSNGTTPSKSVTIAKGSTGNKTYTANWEEKTTTYTVEHYKENLDGTYTKATSDTQQLTAGINTEVTATYKTYTGFSSNTSYESKVESGNVGEDGSLVLKLYYSRKTITVTYNYQYNGGSTATKTTATLKYGASVDLTPTATKDNYTFVGWNTNKNAKQKLSTLTAGTSNITLYAIYSKKITVTYNKNGGSANLTQTYTMYNNETTLSITYPTTPTTYTGWTFECFGDTATSTTGYAKGATRNVTIASATKTLTYYHNWSKNITLTFIDYKNTTKTTRTANTTVYNGNKATLNVPAQNTYTGWTKRGWTTSTSNTAEPTLNAAGGSISNVTANATYYGLYSKNVTVTFNTNGSIITNISNETGTRYTNSYAISTIKNPSITIPSNTIKKPGYTWNEKWNDKIDGSGTSYTKGTSYTFTADKTLYPEYAIDSYAITYNLNGGSLATGVTNPTNYNVKSSNITLNNPTKTGYVFNGWEETIKNIKWTAGITDITTGYIGNSATNPNSVYSEPILLKAGNTYTDSIGTDIRWRIYNLDGTYVGNKSSQATYTPESDCYAIIVHYTGLTEEQQQNLKITVQDPILDVTIPTGSTGNREYKATWDTDTVKYTVYHYLENANDTGYTLHKTERKDGQTNETITLANEKITIANSTYKQGSLTAGGTAATTTTVAANSSTKIYLYYTRNKYKLTLNKNGNIASTTGAGTYKWGQTVNISATLGSTSGYTYKWTNWTSSNTNLLPNQTEQAATITMPAGAITLTANATKTANKYTVTYNYVQNGGDSSTASTKTVTYGTAVDLTPTATKANYVFIGWNTSSTATTGLTSYKMPAKNVTLYAIFKKAVAKIETGTATTYYLTLQDAIDAAGTTKTTVTMIDDVSLPTTVGTVTSGENIVLDLNGHTIQTTGEDIYVIRNTGNLEIQDTLGGGKLTSTTSGIIYNSESGKCVLTTGTIEAGEKNAISNNTNATFEMNGGTITSEAQGINSINTAKVIVKGGKIETVQNAIYNAAGTVEIKGGTLTSGSYAVVRNNEDTGIINISAGTLKGESYGVYNAKAGTINVSGGTIQCRDGVYNNGKGTINITNGTITGTGAQGVRGGTGTVNISGTPKITGTTFGVSVTTGTLKITGGTIVATEGIGAYAYTTEKTATLTIGTNETTPSVSTTVPSITGKTYGVQVGGTFNFYDGIIKGQSGAGTSIIGTVTSTPTGYGVRKAVETVDSVTTETAILVTKNYAEYNGSTIVSYYETLASATTYATSGNTIKPLTNRTETIESTITVSKNVTLDLNGKTITLNGVTLKNNGTLTIQGTGTLTSSGENTVTNLGTLTKTGTSIIANTSTETYYAISNIEKATATITGGTITSTYRTINNDNKLTITGGTITGSDIAVNNSGTAIITDGKITSTQQVGIYNSETGILTLGTNETTPSVNIAVPSIKGKTYGIQTGGTFNFYDGIIKGQSGAGTSIIGTVTSTPTGYGVRKAVETVDSVTTETAILVTKNYAEYNGSTIISYYETLASATTYATSGNTIKPLGNRTETIEATVTASKNITLDLNGKTITLKNQTLKNNGTLTITGSGTLTGSGANTVTNAGTLTKTGTSKIINTSTSAYGAIGNTGTATISAGTITSAYRTITNSNKLTITGGTITGSDIAVNNSGTVTVTGGTVTSTDKIGIYNTTDGTLTIGTNETTPSVSTTVPSITGKTYGVQAGGTFNFYDGVIKGQSGTGTSINGTITVTPKGYGARKTSSTVDSVTTETAVLVPANYAEYNGSTIISYYETLASATTYATSGNTIKPLGNRTETIEATVTASKNITLDLNGKTITLKNQTLKNNGTLTITGSGTLTGSGANTVTNAGTLTKTGTSKIINTSTSAYGAIGNTGTATISAGTITSAYRTITNSNKLTITGGTITGSDIAVNNSGTVTVTGGTVTSTDKIGIYNTTDGTLTIGTNETTPSVSTTVPSVTGKTYGVQAGKTFNFYDGVIKGQSGAGTSINGTLTATPTGYFAKKTLENDVETAILEQAHTLTINPNGGTWNGKSAVSTVVDAAKAIISLGKATAPNPYVVTYNPNYTGSSTTYVNATRVFDGWTLSGAGGLVNSSAIEEGSFTKTVKTESAGEYFRFTKTVSTALTTSTYYGICLPNYEYTSGNSYTIKFKLRINQLPEGASLKFRHAAINNDYATEGLVKKDYDSTTNGWVDVYMTRTFTGTTITQDSTTYDITPRFEMYTSDIKDKTGTFNFDIKDVMIINNTTGSLIQSTDYAYMYGTNDGTVTAKYTTNAITLKALTRNGYTLDGWYKEAACTNKVGSAGSLYTPTGNITLYAKWKVNNYEETSNNSHVEYYETLAEAISSANSGNHIVVLNNRTETESATIPSGKTLTFNLGAKTVTLNGATLTNNGTLTIEGNGTLTGSGANTVTNNGTFRKIDNSTIKNTSTSKYCAIKNTGTATIEKGTISGEYRAIETSGTQTLTVKGAYTSITAKNCAIYSQGTANTTSVPAVRIESAKLIESTDSVSVYNNGSGLVYITGGTIKQQGSNSVIGNNSTGTIQIAYGIIQGTGTAGYAINNVSTGTVKVENGTISNTVAGTINNGSTGRIEVSGGTITSATTALYNTGAGTINVTGGTITGQNTQAIRGGTGTVSISGSPKITGKAYGVSVTTGTLTITGGTIEATEGIGAYAYNADEVATLTIGTNEATPSVNTSVPSITGKTYGVQVGGTFNFYDGILKGKSGPGTAINGTITATPTGYDVYKTVDNDDIESAILTKNFTLTINPNGGTWNGTTSTSKIVDNSRDIISIGEPTPPTPYVVTYNHNYTGSTNKTANATRIFDIWKLTSGDGTVVGASDIEATSFTKTNKTETAGDYINFKKVVSTAPTESVNYRFNMPNYTYRSGYSYTIKFKLRINQLPEGGVLNFRHAAINNDYATDGLVKKVYNTTTDGWIDVYMTRKFTGTTITQKSTTYDITPRFEMYTSDFKDKTGTFDFDIKDVMIIDNSSYYIVQSTNTAYMYRLRNGTITAQYITNSINLETPTRTGYTFDGWYKEAACTNKVGDAGAEYTPISNITLYAKWKQNNYEEVTSSGAHVNYYVSLASAMANVTSGNTIKPLNNITETVSSTVTASKTVTFNLNGKTVTLNSSSLTNNGKLTITGTGTLTGTSGYTIRNIGTLTKTGASSIKNEGTSQTTVIVNEGTATISAGTINGSYKGIETKGTGTLTISGATVTAKNYAVYSQGTANTTTAPAVKIVSGTIESTAAVSVYNNAAGLIYATGGTIKQQGSNSVIANNSTGTIQLSGATVEKSSGTGGYAAIYNISTGTIKVTSGNINNSVSRAIYNKGAGTINVTGGTISGIVGIYDVEGSISVTSGTINATNGVGIRVGTGTAIISGSSTKITGTTYGVDATTGTTTIKAGTIEATDGIGVQVAGGTLTIGTNETTPSVSTTVPSITGSTKGVNVSSGTFNFYDGVIKGQSGAGTSIVGTVTATPTNYNVYKTVDNDNVESAILMQEHTLTVNQNGGVWNGSSAISRVKDVTKAVISIEEPIAPSPYVITYNHNIEGRPDTKLNAIRVFDGWTLTGQGNLVEGSEIETTTFTKTSKTETAGDYWNFKKVVSTVPTTSTNYRINLPNYEYTSGNSYTIKFKLRINQLPSGVSLVFRNAAINNDYATEGLVKKNYDATTNGWVDVYMTRTFTGTTIVQGSTTYDITPRFEMYTNDIKGKTGTFDFDIKDVRVINNTTGKLVQSTDIAYMYGDGDGTIKSNYKVEPTNLITPVRDGYICEGWYKEAACTNKVGNAGSPYTATGNVTLYAKWKETNYEEVTLDGTHVNYYITLASAMANVTSGNTIKVLVDRTETIASTVTKSKTVILDLNGKTVTLNGVTLKVNGALKITGEGTLTGSGANTITNAGSLTKTGTSTIANTSTSSYYTIKNTGNATLEAGTLTSAYRTIDNSETGEVVVSGATVNSTGEGHTIYNTSTANTTDAPAVKVTSGTVSAVAGISGNSAIRSIGTGLIYLTGGTIESESIYTLYLTNSSLQVDGATIKNINTESTSTGTAISSNGSIKVISGTITSDIGEAMNGSEQITISGGTIQGGTTGITITNANAKLKISGGTIKGTTQAGVLVGDSTVEITGGTITGGGSSTEGVAGILHTGTGSILMYNGKVTCEPGVNYGVKQTGSGTIEVFGGSISSGNGGTGIKQTAGYIRLLEASARYSGAVVSGYYNAIDLTGSTETVELEIGNRSATFDDNSDYKLRRPYISGTGSTILGDNSTNIEITFGNGTIKTTGGSTGQTGGGTTAAYAFFDIPDSQITVRNGYVKQTTGGLYETNYTYLVPEGSANSTNSDNTNTANISNETNTLLKARVTSKLMSVLNNTNKEQNSSNNEDNVSDNTTNQNTIENTKDNNTSEKTKDNNTSEDTKDNTENNENTGKNTEENTVKNTEQNTNETTETDTTNSNENVVEIPKVVQTGGKNYATLAEAINSAENDGMIEILDDISLTEKVTIDESKNIKLSLNSKTISCTSSSTLVNNGTLTIISSGIIRNETDNGVVITNNGTLNIQEGIITTAKNGGKGIYNTKTLNVSGGKIVTEGIGAVGIYNVTKSQLTVTGGIIEITGFGSKAIYNNSEVVFEENSNKNIIPKVVVSGDDGIGIYNSKDSTKCDIKSGEFIVEAEVIENYDLIKNTNEFKSELEKMKPSYGIYNDSEIDVNIEKATIKVERLKGVGILNNSIGSIVLGKNDETLNLATPIIYAISDNTTAIINTKAPYANSADSIATNEKYGNIKFYDGTMSTLVSIKDVVTVILDKHEIVENKGNSVINTILKIIEKQ